MPREAATRPAAAARREGGAEQLGPAALGADAGDEEDRARHQLAQAGDVLGLGGADHRAHPAQPARAGEARGELVDQAGQPLVQRRLGRRQVLQVGGAGVAGANQGEDAGAGARGGLDQRLERVAAEQRVGGEGIGAEARRRPPRASAVSPTSACA